MKFHPILYLIALAAHIPMLVGYSSIMWRKGHYQFFPLLIGVVGWLLYDRLNSKTNSPESEQLNQSSLPVVILACNSIVLMACSLLYSSFLIVPSLMLLIATYVLDRYGWAGFKRVLPIWLLLIFVIPLPGNSDLRLINTMQFAASQLASWILDALGQIHFREGVVLVTHTNQFFTEEACSGIRSLFSSLAAISIYGVIRNYSWQRHLFNIAQTFLWVIVGNAIRVAIVVYVSENWTNAIASGTNHEMLGLAVFALIFVLAISTDRAINAFQFETDPDDEFQETATPEANVAASEIKKPSFAGANWIFAGLFVLLLLFSSSLTYAKSNYFGRMNFDDTQLMTTKEVDLPKQINGWLVSEFEAIVREEGNLLAPNSYVWTLENGSRTVTLSLDSPYSEFHDLTFCYQGLGWAVNTKHDYQTINPELLTTLTISKLGQHGVVFFSAHGRDGQLAYPTDRLSRSTNIKNNIRLGLGLPTTIKSDDDTLLPVSQVQLMRESLNELSEDELTELKELFFAARDALLKSERFSFQREQQN